jgi:GTP cyclohydrolase I
MDGNKLEKAVRMLLEGIGEDPDRGGLRETPRRMASMLQETLGGMEKSPADVLTVLEGEQHDEIVLVKDIPLYSTCEHHMLPFIGLAHVGYIPEGNRITGLSKIVRVVEIYARRLQTQERLTTQIADAIMEHLKPKGVIVIIEAEHLCMVMRGVRSPGAKTTTSVVRGIFREKAATRAEAIQLIRKSAKPKF